jgi:hypothetical protein
MTARMKEGVRWKPLLLLSFTLACLRSSMRLYTVSRRASKLLVGTEPQQRLVLEAQEEVWQMLPLKELQGM